MHDRDTSNPIFFSLFRISLSLTWYQSAAREKKKNFRVSPKAPPSCPATTPPSAVVALPPRRRPASLHPAAVRLASSSHSLRRHLPSCALPICRRAPCSSAVVRPADLPSCALLICSRAPCPSAVVRPAHLPSCALPICRRAPCPSAVVSPCLPASSCHQPHCLLPPSAPLLSGLLSGQLLPAVTPYCRRPAWSPSCRQVPHIP